MGFYLRIGAAALGFAVAVLRGALLMLLVRDRHRVRRFVALRLARYVGRAARLTVRLHGGEHLRAARGALLLPNQQSIVCYGVLAHAYLQVPDPVIVARLTGKWDLPVMTRLFVATGNILVDPARPVLTKRALQMARAALRAGSNVFMFPEGTRWGEPGRLGPFRRGAFALVVDCGAPIIPIVVSPLRPKTDLTARRLDPQTVDVHVLEPVTTTGCTVADEERLLTAVHARMQAELSRLARERAL